MGNNVSSDKSFGDVFILLNKSKYIAGEQVNGTINVSLVKPFPSPEIYLIVEGNEKTKIIYQTTTHSMAFDYDHIKRRNRLSYGLIRYFKAVLLYIFIKRGF